VKEAGTNDAAEFPECEVQFVFSAGRAQFTQDRRWRNAASLDRQRNLQHIREVPGDQFPIDGCEFPPLRSHSVIGVKAPQDSRRNGATGFAA